mmetsp:Transcript_19765/g.49729  ORF Transcript_19765/g.49729 Transcript_19765/m.49729 type:complete len:224 (-) Transcript_19765:2873-3544(-)
MLASVFCHPTTSVSKVARYREANMFCTATWFSSSISKSSSFTFISMMSVPLCASNPSSTTLHAEFSLPSVISILASCLAWSAASSTASGVLCSSIFHMSRSRSLLSMVTLFPVKVMSCVQWRWRSAGSRSSPTNGQNVVHFFSTSAMPKYASHFRSTFTSLSFFPSPLISSSMSIGFTSKNREFRKSSVNSMRICSKAHSERNAVVSSFTDARSFFELFTIPG